MTSVALQMPVRTRKAVELSKGLWRKQILKKGTIDYRGKKITFDDDTMTELAKSFKDGAFDQVPFQLVTDGNEHTADPERFRGQIRGLIPTASGLDALIETTDAGSELIRNNPKLGVSCRIVPNLEHADGRKFGAVLEHVAATLNPVITGMTGWQAIALSNESTTVVDLTAAPYQGKEAVMAEQLTADELKTLKALLAKAEGGSGGTGVASPAGTVSGSATSGDTGAPAGGATGGAAGGQGGGKGDAPQGQEGVQGIQARAGNKPELVNAFDAELDKLLADALAEAEAERVTAGDTSNLSATERQAIELARAEAEAVRHENAGIRAELDLAKFDREKADLVAKGVPPAIVDLAMPLLLGAGHSIDLANGTKADAGEIMRKVLHELEGIVDFSAEHLGAPSAPASDKTKSILDQWQKEYGGTILPIAST